MFSTCSECMPTDRVGEERLLFLDFANNIYYCTITKIGDQKENT